MVVVQLAGLQAEVSDQERLGLVVWAEASSPCRVGRALVECWGLVPWLVQGRWLVAVVVVVVVAWTLVEQWQAECC